MRYIPYYTILYYTILYHTILYYTILYYTVPFCTILYCTILYYTTFFPQPVRGRVRERRGAERVGKHVTIICHHVICYACNRML